MDVGYLYAFMNGGTNGEVLARSNWLCCPCV